MWFPPLTDAESDAVRDSLGDAYAGVDRAASPSRTALSFFGIDRQTSSLKLAGTFIISSGMSIREAIEYLKRTGVLMYSGEPPRVIHGVTPQGPKEETMSQHGVKPGQRWMPKNSYQTFQDGRQIESVGDGRYTCTDAGGGPLDFLLENFTLCLCAALHFGPCESAKIEPERPTDPRWEAVPPMYYDAWYCTQDYPGKTDCCGALAQHALPDRDPDGSITGGAGACDACWLAGRREPLNDQMTVAAPAPPVVPTAKLPHQDWGVHPGLTEHMFCTHLECIGKFRRAVVTRGLEGACEIHRLHAPSPAVTKPASVVTKPACRLGPACTHHNPPRPNPYVPEVGDLDLLPDASPMFLGGVRYRR